MNSQFDVFKRFTPEIEPDGEDEVVLDVAGFIGADDGFWFSAKSSFQDTAGTIPALSGTPVAFASDLSGKGFNLVQDVQSKKPLLGVDTDGAKFILVDAVDDALQSTVNFPLKTGSTFMAVVSAAKYGGSWYPFAAVDGANDYLRAYIRRQPTPDYRVSAALRFGGGFVSAQVVPTNGFVYLQKILVVIDVGTTSLTIRQDESEVLTKTTAHSYGTTTTTDSCKVTLGSVSVQDSGSIRIYNMMMVNRTLTVEERATAIAELKRDAKMA